MLRGFLYTTVPMVCLLSACSQSSSESKVGEQSACPKVRPASTPIENATLYDWMRGVRLEPAPNAAVMNELRKLALTSPWTIQERRTLRRVSMDIVQRYTPKHFIDLGRRIAWSTVRDRHSFPDGVDRLTSALNPSEARSLLGAIVGSPPPEVKTLNGKDALIQYVLALHAWSRMLEDKFQLSSWWTPFEFRWLLESRVLGYQDADLSLQLKAHQTLRTKIHYPAAHNDAVMRLWRGEVRTTQELGPLGDSIPHHCFQRYQR